MASEAEKFKDIFRLAQEIIAGRDPKTNRVTRAAEVIADHAQLGYVELTGEDPMQVLKEDEVKEDPWKYAWWRPIAELHAEIDGARQGSWSPGSWVCACGACQVARAAGWKPKEEPNAG